MARPAAIIRKSTICPEIEKFILTKLKKFDGQTIIDTKRVTALKILHNTLRNMSKIYIRICCYKALT